MPWALHSLLFLSLSPSLAFARAPAIRGRNVPVYGDNTFRQVATTTVTVTDVRTVTVGESSCEVIYMPTTVTVYTGSVDGLSTASAGPIRSDTSRGPWANATSGSGSNTPCSHGLPSSTRFVTATSPRPISSASRNASTSASWNRTTVVPRPTLSGTAGTTVEGADPIGTSSLLWTNSTRPSATSGSVTTGSPFPLTSSTVFPVSAGVTAPSGGYSGPVPSSGYGTGTASPGNSSVGGGPAPYQPSLTYQTTVPESSPSSTPVDGTAEPSTSPFTFSLPPGWSISTVRHTSSTSTPALSSTVLTTESNDPIFTTTSTHARNSTITLLPTSSSASVPPSPSPSGSSSAELPDYGSYTYPAPSSSSSSADEYPVPSTSSSADEYPLPSSSTDEYPLPSSSSAAEYPLPSSSAAEYPVPSSSSANSPILSSSSTDYPPPSSSSATEYPTPSSSSALVFSTDSADAIGGTHSPSPSPSTSTGLEPTPSSAPEFPSTSTEEATATATATATAIVTVTSFESETGTSSSAAATSTSSAADDMYDEGGEDGELYGGEYGGGDGGYGGYQY